MPVARTSIDAHRPETRGRQEAMVLDYLRTQSAGATREEIAQALGLKESSVCGRVNALVKKGDAYERGHRFSSFGCHSSVVYATGGKQGELI